MNSTAEWITQAFVYLGAASIVSALVHHVWASFHTRPERSQLRALFGSMYDSSGHTERGQDLLFRMWISYIVAALAWVVAVVIVAS